MSRTRAGGLEIADMITLRAVGLADLLLFCIDLGGLGV